MKGMASLMKETPKRTAEKMMGMAVMTGNRLNTSWNISVLTGSGRYLTQTRAECERERAGIKCIAYTPTALIVNVFKFVIWG